jgi:hypothetical protein
MSTKATFTRPAPKPRRAGQGKLAMGTDAIVPVLNDKMKLLLQTMKTKNTCDA